MLSFLSYSAVTEQDAFAAQKTQPSKKINCAKPVKVSKSRATCTVKKTPAKPITNANSVTAGSNVSAPPISNPTLLLKTDSVECKLPSQNTRGDVEVGFPKVSNRVRSVGEIHSLMIFVDFSDAPATVEAKTVYSYFDSAPAILKDLTYGKTNLHIATDVQWHRMSKSSASYAQDLTASFLGLRAFMSEAIALASKTNDLTGIDLVYVVTSPNTKNVTHSMAFVARPGSEISIGGTTISNGAIFGSNTSSAYAKTLVHETSHTFGLVDDWNVNYNSSTPNDAFRFTGDFSIMGSLYGVAPEYFAWESWLMDWLDDSQVNCFAPGDQTFTLQSLESSGGIKMAVIPTSATQAVIVEYRRQTLADKRLPTSGVLVYTIDTKIPSASGPLRVVGGTASRQLTDALLTNGEHLSVGNVNLKVISLTADTSTINLSFN